jgi:tetratricopeptide (TPR) repeat protein
MNAPNATRELRVMYFPAAKGAKLKDPQSLTLHVGFSGPGASSGSTVPFVRKDGFWKAIVPLEKFNAWYTIFFVRDDKAGIVDDNGGQLWDVVSCVPNGQKNVNGVLAQARSYTAVSGSAGIPRSKDYAKAVSVLEAALASGVPPWALREALREDKAQQGGGDAQAWAKVAGEIGQFATNNQDDKRSVAIVSNFIAFHTEVLPADFVEQMIDLLDKTDPKSSLRARVEMNRAMRNPDRQKRLAALDAFVAKYPDSTTVSSAQANRLSILVEMGDVEGAETAFAKYREGMQRDRIRSANPDLIYLALVRLYLDKKTKLDEALKLIDETLEAVRPSSANPGMAGYVQQVEGHCAQLRARAYLALSKPDLAVTEARKALEHRKTAENYFLLAQALAALGDKEKALDAYFEAVLLPSNKDVEYSQELQQFYLKQHFGNRRQFEAALENRKQAHFRAVDYVPNLVDLAAPPVELSTLTGETFNATTLAGKTTIVNLWSPG